MDIMKNPDNLISQDLSSDAGSAASRARTELTSSKYDWTRIWTI